MTEHGLGLALRAALQQQGQMPGPAADLHSLEARLPQMVAADQQDLLPALSFLLRSRALASALAQPGGSDDGRIAARLLTEVQAQYSPAICRRLQGVIQGLVGMAEQPGASTAWPGPPTAASPPAVAAVVTGGGDGSWLVALLGFLIGIVGSGLVLLVWLQQQSRQPSSGSAAQPAPLSAAAPPSAPPGIAASNAAVASIEELYRALSAKDFATAASHYGPGAADQFDPSFFDQFERVTVADLHQTSSTGSMLNLQGVVTFVYPNGDVQSETRSFTVDTRSTPALITSSEFGRILQSR